MSTTIETMTGERARLWAKVVAARVAERRAATAWARARGWAIEEREAWQRALAALKRAEASLARACGRVTARRGLAA